MVLRKSGVVSTTRIALDSPALVQNTTAGPTLTTVLVCGQLKNHSATYNTGAAGSSLM